MHKEQGCKQQPVYLLSSSSQTLVSPHDLLPTKLGLESAFQEKAGLSASPQSQRILFKPATFRWGLNPTQRDSSKQMFKWVLQAQLPWHLSLGTFAKLTPTRLVPSGNARAAKARVPHTRVTEMSEEPRHSSCPFAITPLPNPSYPRQPLSCCQCRLDWISRMLYKRNWISGGIWLI